jgi:uncharacterized protein YceK
MHRFLSLLVLTTCLSGCTAVSSYTLVGGKPGYEVYCSAFLPKQCADRAAQQCPKGYTVLLNPQVESQSAYKLVRNADDSGNRLDFSCNE